jgi:hypothetical protein
MHLYMENFLNGQKIIGLPSADMARLIHSIISPIHSLVCQLVHLLWTWFPRKINQLLQIVYPCNYKISMGIYRKKVCSQSRIELSRFKQILHIRMHIRVTKISPFNNFVSQKLSTKKYVIRIFKYLYIISNKYLNLVILTIWQKKMCTYTVFNLKSRL